jgi:hypothetical protein
VPIILKCGSLNLLEPSGPVKVCNGNALPCFTIGKVIFEKSLSDLKGDGYAYLASYSNTIPTVTAVFGCTSRL